MKKLLALLALVCVTLMACGGGDDAEAPADDAAADAAPASQPADEH